MALNFGYDEHPPNHIHNIKPLVALPYYQIVVSNFLFKYTLGINVNVWREPAKEANYIPRRDIVTLNVVEPKNSQIELFAHTFDSDVNIKSLTMRYELMCFMIDGSTEYKLIDEFDMMPFKIVPGAVDDMNHFLFKGQKKYFISDLQPNYKNMFKMGVRIKNVASTQSLHNEGILEVLLIHRQNVKQLNDALLQVL